MKNELDVKKITRQLEEVEKSNAHRKGTFKIASTFVSA